MDDQIFPQGRPICYNIDMGLLLQFSSVNCLQSIWAAPRLSQNFLILIILSFCRTLTLLFKPLTPLRYTQVLSWTPLPSLTSRVQSTRLNYDGSLVMREYQATKGRTNLPWRDQQSHPLDPNPSFHILATSSSRRFEHTCSTNILRHTNKKVSVIRGKSLSFISLSIQGKTPRPFPGTI